MYVFRDGRRIVSGSELITSLIVALERWRSASANTLEDCVVGALIAAAELECALLDEAGGACSDSSKIAAEITEALACALLTGQRHSLVSILSNVEHIRVAASYETAVPEGFAYYGLHPRKMAMLLDPLVVDRPMAVLGIRSIGVTLSAVACASLRLRGIPCRRITVRPTGHPYDRKLEITPELREWIEHSPDSGFLIVDEGPGISGSSFLAVAEALVECGVEDEGIQMIGSREVDPATLRAANARERWTRYLFHIMQNHPMYPAGAGENLSGGLWRSHFACEQSTMPGTWAPLEVAKFLAGDGHSICKFEGFGHYGEAIGVRAKLLADHGFSPRYLGNHCGFGKYELVSGCGLTLGDKSPELLERMADYLALRAKAFCSKATQTPELEGMLRRNWQLEFGEELNDDESRLRTERVTVCDGRMMPHEWLRADSGELLKLDAGSHGDNHFFPGPCDIAWDVAGTIVEWELQGELHDYFVREYEAHSGDGIAGRLAPYLLAYAIFRLGWSKMAALAMHGEYDEALLERDYQRYRAIAMRLQREQRARDSESDERLANASPSLVRKSTSSNKTPR